MANRQRAEARRKAQAKAARADGEGGGSKLAIWIALGVVIVLGVGIAIFAAGGDEETATATTDASGSTIPALPDSQPVTVSGDPLSSFDSSASPDPAVGVAAPVITGMNFTGEAVTIDPATSKAPYMVVFLAHWCPHCNAEVPRLLDWKHSGAVPTELQVIGVATAVSASAANYPPATWFSNKGWEWPVLVDQSQGDGAAGVAAEAYGASGWPYFVIVGADGKVKARVSGEVEISELETIVADALAA